jgi:hypothetical protein
MVDMAKRIARCCDDIEFCLDAGFELSQYIYDFDPARDPSDEVNFYCETVPVMRNVKYCPWCSRRFGLVEE